MKKLVSALVALALLAGAAAPAFAQSEIQNCAFKDKSLCVNTLLGETNIGDD
jgi:hypothetical protein